MVADMGAAGGLYDMAALGDRVLFVVSPQAPQGGDELWVTDGTPDGTRRLRQFQSFNFYDSVAAGGALFFKAEDAQTGSELWVTDGTVEGTRLVKDITAGLGSTSVAGLTAFGNAILFRTGGGSSPYRLWRTDGTEAGTVALLETSQFPWLQPTPFRGEAFFSLRETDHSSLWATDGTKAGTRRVGDLLAGMYLWSDPFVEFGGALYFSSGGLLWRTDGTESGTAPVPAATGAPRPIVAKLLGGLAGRLIFTGTTGEMGQELWETNGTPAGTRLVGDIFPGPTGSDPGDAIIAGNALYFAATDSEHGRELWKYTPDPAPSAVVDRHVFYNDSGFDGRNPAANAGDDAAIATDKHARLPGQAGSFDNVTSYVRGINGVMIDVANLPAGQSLSADDFELSSAAPDSISVRRGAGANGSDRVTLAWAQGVRNGWLRVMVKATAATGLSSPDVFSFGNLVGETGDASTPGRVSALDLVTVRRAAFSAAPITSPLDLNRDGRVNALDLAAVRGALGRVLALPTGGVLSESPSVGSTRILMDEGPSVR
jgi:ELWxxDGT repeat protein